MRVLIVGGYGTFGGRIVDLLLDESRLTIWVAGRRLDAARQFCSMRQGLAKLIPLEFDRLNCSELLKELRPDLVVDASGPFQGYGNDPYRLVRDSLAAGSDYVDLADGADFVASISTLNELAQKSNRFALSGMSSFPVLTAAVVRKLAQGMDRLEHVAAGIAPSPFAGVGLNVIRAIASYSGKPVKVLHDGKWRDGAGFFDDRRFVVNVPGEVPLRSIRFALTDVPDIKVLSWDWPELKSIWMGAGPTPALLHRLLWVMAGMVKFRLLPSLLPLAPVMNWVINTVRWGEHRGGMIVEVTGQSSCQNIKRSWHLLAEGDGGPLIPSMAVEAIILRCLAGQRPSSGARSGHRDLELEAYAPLLSRHGIKTGIRDETEATKSLSIYEQVMGEAFTRLAPPLQNFHGMKSSFSMQGKAEVVRGRSLASRLVGTLFGFPGAGENVDVAVKIDVGACCESWTRSFAQNTFKSRQSLGRGRSEGLIFESFGPFNFAMAVVETEGQLGLKIRGWNCWGVPLPRRLMPRSTAIEHGADGRFNFDVDIGLPMVGRIVRYRGWLEWS